VLLRAGMPLCRHHSVARARASRRTLPPLPALQWPGLRGKTPGAPPQATSDTAQENLMHRPVRTAIFPVGGLGVRFLPATKAVPKEMLPVVDKPLIQYAVEEAKTAGIEHFVFVTSRGKAAIEDHFDFSFELNATLVERKKQRELDLVAGIQ